MNPFRILIIDDDFYGTASKPVWRSAPSFKEKDAFGFLKDMMRGRSTEQSAETGDMEIFISKDGAFSDTVLALHTGGADKKRVEFSGEKLGEFLRSLNVLVLDLGGITLRTPLPTLEQVTANLGRCGPKTYSQETSNPSLSRASDFMAEITTGKYPGVGFYHQHLDDLCCCKAVIVLTQYDDLHNPPEAVRQGLWPFCQGHHDHPYSDSALAPTSRLPWTTMVAKSSGSEWIKMVIGSLHRSYTKGFTDLSNQGAVELAALRDEAVFLLGETGTGKETMARRIHDRWVDEHRRRERNFPDNFVPINCAGLSEELARSELFGHVAGSFTDAKDHRLGAILKACGVSKLSPTRKGAKREDFQKAISQLKTATDALQNIQLTGNAGKDAAKYAVLFPVLNEIFATTGAQNTANISLIEALFEAAKRLERASRGGNQVEDFYERLADCENIEKTAEPLDLRYTHAGPVGTLFLDEFGDLPLAVQTLLLRFLDDETREIQPIGYPGRITGLRARLIVATSDPRVAKFFGVSLLGGDRSLEETSRPLRQDMLFRLKHQIIRVEPVDENNFERVFDDLQSRLDLKGKIHWSQAAKDKLKTLVTRVLKDIRDEKPAAFGHRRELNQFLKLVRDYVSTAHARGVRDGIPVTEDGVPEVTPAVVERLWLPAKVAISTGISLPAFSQTSATLPQSMGVPERWTIDRFETDGVVKKGDILYHILDLLLKNLGTEVSSEKIIEQINSLRLRTRRGGSVNLTKASLPKKISYLNKQVLQKQTCAAAKFKIRSNSIGYKLLSGS